MSLSKLTEALELFDNPDGSETWEADRTMGQALGVIADAARKYSWLVEPCTTCNGTGKEPPHPEVNMVTLPNRCLACGGSGVVPSEQAIEVVAKALTRQRFGEPQDFASEVMDMQIPVTLIGEARAVVLALLEGTE